MPDITVVAGRVAGIVSLAAFVPYILGILRGKTTPNRATWLIWTVVSFMLGTSYYASGANHTIWVPVIYAVSSLVIAIFSIKYGKDGWARLDKYCLFIAGISMILWWMFSSPLIALIINLFIDFIGALPTIRKAYHEPESEDRTAWTLLFIGNTANMFAVEDWTFRIAVYPIYMFIVNGLIITLLFVRRSYAVKAK